MPEKDNIINKDSKNLKADNQNQDSKIKEDKKLIAGTSLWSEAWRRLRKNKVAIICVVIILIIFSACTIYAIPHLSSLSKKGAFELSFAYVAKRKSAPYEYSIFFCPRF